MLHTCMLFYPGVSTLTELNKLCTFMISDIIAMPIHDLMEAKRKQKCKI